MFGRTAHDLINCAKMRTLDGTCAGRRSPHQHTPHRIASPAHTSRTPWERDRRSAAHARRHVRTNSHARARARTHSRSSRTCARVCHGCEAAGRFGGRFLWLAVRRLAALRWFNSISILLYVRVHFAHVTRMFWLPPPKPSTTDAHARASIAYLFVHNARPKRRRF